MFVILFVPVCPLRVCLCVTLNQNTSKNHAISVKTSKFDVLLDKTHSKVLLELMYQGSTSLGLQ